MAEADKPTKAMVGERWRLAWLYGGTIALLAFLILTRPGGDEATASQVSGWARRQESEDEYPYPLRIHKETHTREKLISIAHLTGGIKPILTTAHPIYTRWHAMSQH